MKYIYYLIEIVKFQIRKIFQITFELKHDLKKIRSFFHSIKWDQNYPIRYSTYPQQSEGWLFNRGGHEKHGNTLMMT